MTPKHIAIIMDGNGRWAKQRGLERPEGHKAGAKQVGVIAKAAMAMGVEAMTLYAFSTENWNRPEAEVRLLMELFMGYAKSALSDLNKNNIRLLASGRLDGLPLLTRTAVKAAVAATAKNSGFTINICLNYGGHAELTDAVNAILKKRLATGDSTPVTEQDIAAALYAPQLPPIDLMIRPGGEQRLSNFQLWELAYAELYFTPVLWPDFTEEELKKAIDVFNNRNRRFGAIK